MADREATIAQMIKAADQIKAENDNFLRAVAMLAANGRAQIIPADSAILGPQKALFCLPREQYERLIKLVNKEPDR